MYYMVIKSNKKPQKEVTVNLTHTHTLYIYSNYVVVYVIRSNPMMFPIDLEQDLGSVPKEMD